MTTNDPRVTWAVAEMHRHLSRPLSACGLAARVNLSPARFRQLFVAQTGAAPGPYLQRLRLRRARVLIERTFLSVKEVMALVGYSDASHFSRDFRQHHGMPPGALRGTGAATPLPPDSSCPWRPEDTPELSKPPRQKRIRRGRTRDPSTSPPIRPGRQGAPLSASAMAPAGPDTTR